MNVGIPREQNSRETRVAIVPSVIRQLKRDGHEILVESGAGLAAHFPDEQYAAEGARILTQTAELYRESDIILGVQAPADAGLLRQGSIWIGMLAPQSNRALVSAMAERNITTYAMEYVPRITRAQNMDALSSMATVAGYKSVLLAADTIGKMFPLLMTAAGTVHPAVVLVLGAGVAGLQAIATAKRLGAKVEAFDPRPAVREQVKSLGAAFIEMEIAEDAETAGGYARQMSEEFIRKEMAAISSRLPKVDGVISTAQVFGKRAPILISKEMVRLLKPGSVIVDLAAEQGGNCELTRPGETVREGGVTCIGPVNLPASIPSDASQMYARNITNLLLHLFPKGNPNSDTTDEIVRGCCITRDGKIVNDAVRQALQEGAQS